MKDHSFSNFHHEVRTPSLFPVTVAALAQDQVVPAKVAWGDEAPDDGFEIVGGQEAQFGKHRYVAGLKESPNVFHNCCTVAVIMGSAFNFAFSFVDLFLAIPLADTLVCSIVTPSGDDLEEGGDALTEQSHCSTLRIKASMVQMPEAKDAVEAALQDLINEAINNFNLSDPPAVKPLKVTPKDGCVPYRCKGQKHNLLEESFLYLFAKELYDAGVIKRNQQSPWCSPVNPPLKIADQWTDDDVLKNYRLTNDYRVVNSMTKPKAGTMPFQATIFQNLREMKAMGVFDLPKYFW
ncbi:hypothetical protein H257_14243 [Aphanomyces astaci]|uniref:Uncharacterized protein n=1 Tax=Aphanomyces astaci TaxID=112090 RepID=W4FTE7_APHAT|nr:hypothetical protein H257_14243 [Aphanomyces astaci]ETV70211.1 hypothetical protein H257_14243 [Aphanomyces astaci]|eukprot:XP_009840307.1 hypothetical protein H257_14243 [Aphanomyces astaci]